MIQDGRVRLDTTLRELLPAARIPRPADSAGPREITLQDLATHRSGLPTMPSRRLNRDNPFANVTANDLYAYLRRRGVERPADAPFAYSNLGFGLLGHALASRTHSDYATLVRQLVAEPLGLPDTVIDLSPDQRRRLMQGYDDEGTPLPAWKFDVLAPAGAVFSTAPDLLAWLEANLHPAGPLAAALELTHRPLAATRGGARIGLAWMIDPATGNIGHDGGVQGYTADVFFNRGDDVAAVVLANRGPGVSAPAPLVADHIRARLAGRPAISLGSVVVPAAGGARGWLRLVFAYWITMIAAGAFVAGLMIGLQGLTAALLPWRVFLRVSPILQVTAFYVLVGGYLMQPIVFVVDDLVAAQSGGLFGSSPSYWFLGLFQSLIGSSAMPLLAARARTAVVLAVVIAGFAYAVSYFRTVREIAEEPDIMATGHVPQMPFIGRGPTRAIADFSLKTLVRSAQPRGAMAFYWGAGFAFAIAFVKTPTGQRLAAGSDSGAWHETSVPLLVASILMMGASIVAARNAFAMPRDLKANWIFRMAPPRDGREYAVGRRRAMIAVTVVPVCAMAALLCVPIWPWQAALGHVAALGLLGLVLVDAADAGTRKIPFACSYLPGRSRFHLVFVVIVVVVIPLVLAAASFERDALQNPARYGAMIGLLVVVWLLARWRIRRLVHPDDGAPAFDDEPADRLVTLELWDSRVAGPISSPLSGSRSSSPRA
jgi:CubicO group peptidase (beta-lactamase class C family)